MPACRTPQFPVWNMNIAAIYEQCQKYVKIPGKNGCILPLSCHEWQVMGPKEVFYVLIFSARDDLVKVS